MFVSVLNKIHLSLFMITLLTMLQRNVSSIRGQRNRKIDINLFIRRHHIQPSHHAPRGKSHKGLCVYQESDLWDMSCCTTSEYKVAQGGAVKS